jgi:hypothetical protein
MYLLVLTPGKRAVNPIAGKQSTARNSHVKLWATCGDRGDRVHSAPLIGTRESLLARSLPLFFSRYR